MSRTDKTNPWRVKKKDPRLVTIYTDQPHFGSVIWPKWWIGESHCGCSLCTDQIQRKINARRERRAGKRVARNWEQEYE